MSPERHTGCAGACQCGARVREGPGTAPVRSGVRRACLHPLRSRTGPCGRRARRDAGAVACLHPAERSAGTAPSGKPGGRPHAGTRALPRDRACMGRKVMPHAATRGMQTTGMKKAPLDERGFDQHWPEDRRLPYSASAAGASASASGWASSSTTGWSETTFTGTVATMLACRRTRTG